MTHSVITIRIFHNFKSLNFRIDIFNKNTLTRDTAVFSFFIIGQFFTLGLFLRSFTVSMKCGNTLIPTVSLFFNGFKYTAANCIFINLKIMGFAAILGSTYNFSIRSVYNYLCFYCVSFLFARVPFPLFF